VSLEPLDAAAQITDSLPTASGGQGQPRLPTPLRDVSQRRQAGAAVERERPALMHLLQSSDRDRQRIAYVIHDGLAQHLAGAIMQFQAFEHLKDRDSGLAAKVYATGLAMLRQSHFVPRRLIAGIRPPILDELGVVEAVAHLVHEQSRESGPKIEYCSMVDFDRLVPIFEDAIYCVCQEGLANACSHSRSQRVWRQQGGRVRIEVRDWGTGFDAGVVPGNGFGLKGIRQRARLLGGKCSIRSGSRKGTRVRVELPVVKRREG
jgi:signal transduction histidine kinase